MIFINNSTKAEQKEWHEKYLNSFRTHADDYLQYAPQVAVLGLDLVGVKSKHSFADKAGVLLIGSALMVGTTTGLKNLTHVTRPDDSGNDSFPSGHTANAFFGAAVFAEEYGDKSVWYTIGGYTAATATGTLRMLNNRHWLSDVLVGAGIGVLSAKAAYIIYPWLKEKLGKHKPGNVAIVPIYDGRTMGGSVVVGF
ncbi:phosphatase PAP2 family protein [Pseudarcicella hirudinis]